MLEPEQQSSTSNKIPASKFLVNRTEDGEQPIDRVIVNRCFNESLLCRESSSTAVPEILRHSYQLSEVQTLNDATVQVLHVLMLESGFVPQDTGRSDNISLPLNAKLNHIYQIIYVHVSCPEQVAVFTCIPVGNVLSINANIGTSTFHMSLQPSVYVKRSQLNAAANVASVYENIPKLSRLFKDSIVYQLLSMLRIEEGLTPCGITNMAMEVKLLLFSFFDLRTLIKASEVCKEFRTLSDEPTLWKRLCFTDFPDNTSQMLWMEDSTSWKEKYKILYKQRQQRIEVMKIFYTVPFMRYDLPRLPRIFPLSDPFNPLSDPFNPLRPEYFNPFQPIRPPFRHGDYDRIFKFN